MWCSWWFPANDVLQCGVHGASMARIIVVQYPRTTTNSSEFIHEFISCLGAFCCPLFFFMTYSVIEGLTTRLLYKKGSGSKKMPHQI
jgi:hypothetical protein